MSGVTSPVDYHPVGPVGVTISLEVKGVRQDFEVIEVSGVPRRLVKGRIPGIVEFVKIVLS